MRVSQVVFSSDEAYLVISAEQRGGLAVYDVGALMQGSTNPAFELSTEGAVLRGLVPNPTAEKAEYFAVITVDGKLLMANLKERRFLSGPNGSVLKSGVSCVSWSTRGKQLAAGLGDGTVSQMTPEGEEKAVIPKPPNLEGDQHG
jgi:nucleoporin NUP159